MSMMQKLPVCVLLLASFAGATQIWTVTGTTSGKVSATVAFTVTANQVLLQITNLTVNPSDVAQSLTALSFGLDNGGTPVTVSGTVLSASGTLRTVKSTAPGGYSDAPTTAPRWGLSLIGGSYEIISPLPGRTLLGAPDGNNAYSAANASIVGNGPHNPFLANTITIVLNLNGVDENTQVDFVNFIFGTNLQFSLAGSCTGENCAVIPPQEVPEAASFLFGGTGLAAMAFLRRRVARC